MPRVLVTVFAFAWIALSPSRSAAAAADDADTRRARSHLKAGVAYYDEAKYDDALREMDAAYRLRPLPDLQYNIAQCHERLGHVRQAVQAYKHYLAGKPDADDRDEVAARVKNLEERAAKEASGAAVPAATPQVVEKEKIVLKEVVVYRDAPARPGQGARVAGWVLGVVAVGALASGVAFAVLAQQNADTVTAGGNPQAPVPFTGAVADAQAAGKQDRILSYASFGVAALGAAGAIGLFVLAARIDRDAARLAAQASVAPTLLPGGGGGLVLAGRF